jgi:uncharacterized membrane protein
VSPDAHRPPFRPGPFVAGGLFSAACAAAGCALLGLVGAQLSRSDALVTAGVVGVVLAAVVAAILWHGRAWTLGASVIVSALRYLALFALARIEATVRRDAGRGDDLGDL